MYLAEALTTMRPIVLDEEENKLRLHLVTGAAVKQGGDEVNDHQDRRKNMMTSRMMMMRRISAAGCNTYCQVTSFLSVSTNKK